jgi:3-oxoacyl-[acyl-carrier protein] reductase
MNQRVAIITGAANGLGKAVAEKLLNDGGTVHLLDNDENQLSETVKQLREEFPDLTSNVLDVRRQEECELSVSNCVEAHGTVDILVNCAGIYPRVDILEITAEQWHLDLDINVLGTYFMMVAAYKVMQVKRFGRIVNISSIDAYIAHPTNAHYAASKAAVVSLTRSFAIAAASSGVTVNSVAPGPLATEKAKQADWYEGAVNALPTGTPIEPKEIAETVAFLARPENRSITGENIIVSAGGVIA